MIRSSSSASTTLSSSSGVNTLFPTERQRITFQPIKRSPNFTSQIRKNYREKFPINIVSWINTSLLSDAVVYPFEIWFVSVFNFQGYYLGQLIAVKGQYSSLHPREYLRSRFDDDQAFAVMHGLSFPSVMGGYWDDVHTSGEFSFNEVFSDPIGFLCVCGCGENYDSGHGKSQKGFSWTP